MPLDHLIFATAIWCNITGVGKSNLFIALLESPYKAPLAFCMRIHGYGKNEPTYK